VGYRLGASITAPVLTVRSATFTVTAGGVSPSLSAVSASPPTIAASSPPGATVSTITVTARDLNGNPVPNATVVLSATPTTGNTLTQPLSTTNTNGIATGTLSSTKAEGKTVSATINGVAVTQTASVTVTAAAPSQLVFTTQPTNTPAGAAITPPIQVTAFDQFNNLATAFGGSITMSIGTNPPGTGVLSGPNPVTAVGGTATFSNLSINKAGTGYRLSASGPGTGTSSAFDVTASAATKLVITIEPSTPDSSGVPFGVQPVVQLRDANDNNVSQSGTVVTASVAVGPAGAAFTNATATTLATGAATFSGLAVSGTVGSYRLQMASGTLTPDTTVAITLTSGRATKLVLATQPSSSVQNAIAFQQQPVVQLQDAASNNVNQAGVAVTRRSRPAAGRCPPPAPC